MNIPSVIKKAAAWYVKNVPGSEVAYLGQWRSSEAYWVKIPDGIFVTPPVLLLKNKKVTKVNGEDALIIISSLSQPY